MQKIASFQVDHNLLTPGIYVSRVDFSDIVTYDLRFKTPNAGDYLDPAAAHTIEHLFATARPQRSPWRQHRLFRAHGLPYRLLSYLQRRFPSRRHPGDPQDRSVDDGLFGDDSGKRKKGMRKLSVS